MIRWKKNINKAFDLSSIKLASLVFGGQGLRHDACDTIVTGLTQPCISHQLHMIVAMLASLLLCSGRTNEHLSRVLATGPAGNRFITFLR